MNVAIYGGSFDPPHLGHVMVVTHLLLNDHTIDQVYVVPCFRQRGKKLLPFEYRMDMCRSAFEWLPRVRVRSDELQVKDAHPEVSESLTINLVRHLKSLEPDSRFRFVMGADLLASAPNWESWEEIRTMAPPLVVGRAGISPLGPGDPTPISPIISSSIVREALAARDYVKAGRYLPLKVCSYIEQNGYYAVPDPYGPRLGD